jgi:hypothetical protein
VGLRVGMDMTAMRKILPLLEWNLVVQLSHLTTELSRLVPIVTEHTDINCLFSGAQRLNYAVLSKATP